MRLQSVSLERGLSEPEAASALALGKGPAETLFNNGLNGSLLPLSQLPHFIVKTIGYLYGCFHIASHIISYGMMSNKGYLPSIEVEMDSRRFAAGGLVIYVLTPDDPLFSRVVATSSR